MVGIEDAKTYNEQDLYSKSTSYGQTISKNKKGSKAWNKGIKMSEEFCQHNSEAHKGMRRSKESIEKQKQTIANNPNFGNKGKHLSYETKRKLSLNRLGKTPCNKGTTKYSLEMCNTLEKLLNDGFSYEYIIDVYKPDFNLNKYMINHLIKYKEAPHIRKARMKLLRDEQRKKCND